MKILGISGSGRQNGYSTMITKDILNHTNCEYEFISLAGKRINGCIGCLKCAADNICVQKDDFNSIVDKMIKADVIVFAGPCYFRGLNAISTAFWERTFCLRHREVFPLAGKLGVAVGIDLREEKFATKRIKQMMEYNLMSIISTFTNPRHYQCYDCGYGHDCVVGITYKIHGLCSKEYAEENRPMEYKDDEDAKQKVKAIGKLIGSIVKGREKRDS